MIEKKSFYTVKDVSEALEVSISTVHVYIKDGIVDAYQVQGRGPWRIKPIEYERLLEGSN